MARLTFVVALIDVLRVVFEAQSAQETRLCGPYLITNYKTRILL